MLITDAHTHRKYTDGCSGFVRNAFLPRTETLNRINYFVSAGLHPWYIDNNWAGAYSGLLDVVQHPRVVAIGECGLDYFHGPDKAVQWHVFEAHLALAQQLKLPVIVHLVRAIHDLIPFIKSRPNTLVLHDYRGTEEETKKLLDYDVYFSMGRSYVKNINRSARFIPANRLLTESDTGKISVQDVLTKLNTELPEQGGIAQLNEQITKNFFNVYPKIKS
ncbi:MAG: TatD family hydrolase [Bacteroidetes bacterium]|jgi:TatD DNase family protein|nr:TatD family hydrolase [Bacteroidota bacterium]